MKIKTHVIFAFLFLFCCALFCVLSDFAITLKRKRDLVALLILSYGRLVTVFFVF